MGGDFKTGAMAAGASEALANVLTSGFLEGNSEQAKRLQQAAAQLVGIVAAAGVNGDLQMGGDIAKSGMAYNRQLHPEEVRKAKELAKEFAKELGISEQDAEARLLVQGQRNTDQQFAQNHAGFDEAANNFLRQNSSVFVDEQGRQTLMFAPGSPEAYRDPTMYAETWTKYTNEYAAMQGAAPQQTQNERLWAAWKESLATGAAGMGKGAANLPGDMANGATGWVEDFLHLDPSSIPKFQQWMSYDNETEQEVGAATQQFISNAIAVGGTVAGSLAKGSGATAVAKGAGTEGKLVGNLEPGNPASTSLPRNGDRLVIDQGQLPTCGPTSCAMILDTAGKRIDLGALISQSGVTSRGTTMPRLAETLNNNGLPAQRVLGASLEDVAAATAKGNPAIVRMSLDRGGHAVVVDGVTIRNGQEVVAIRDPAFGRQYFTPVEEFRQKFSGEVVYTSR